MTITNEILSSGGVDGSSTAATCHETGCVEFPFVSFLDEEGSGINEVLDSHGNCLGIGLTKIRCIDFHTTVLNLLDAQTVVDTHSHETMLSEIGEHRLAYLARPVFP
ncbi:MAG: hypothetical protein J6S65_03375, partial [Bacteroidaceae bacterium]|nr:hypothetical protein [Bacteroidaceae bacterium]